MNKYKIQNKLFNFYSLCYVIKLSIIDHMPSKYIKTYQTKRIKRVINKAYQIPVYKDKFDKVGVSPADFQTIDDLVKFPSLSKKEYREWMREEAKKEEVKFYKLTHTSGSTGIPTINIYPPKEYAQHYMADFFGWMKGGYNPFFGKTLTRQPGDDSVGTGSFIQKMGILRRDCFNTKGDRKDIIDKINNYKPDFILSNSSELIYIAQYAIENKIDIYKPKYFCPNGENIDGNAERILKQVYGDGLINLYGCTEMASFAVRKPNENFYEIVSQLVATCVSDNDKIKKYGNGSLLVTPLYRTKYPMINYEIGDNVALSEMNGKEIITEICGRKNDVFVWKSGKQTIFMRLYEISEILEDIFQIRFIQESYEKVIFQVVKDPISEKTNAELEVYLYELYKDEFDVGTIIEFEWLDVIPPDPNGKIRVMISKV